MTDPNPSTSPQPTPVVETLRPVAHLQLKAMALLLFTLARDLGYEVVEQLFTRDELYIADEAFFSGTAAEITPIREVDRRTIGTGTAGPISQLIQKEYFKIVKGENPDYANWLHEYSF